jgi:Putative transposase of IS4/5 family (DUF4096)
VPEVRRLVLAMARPEEEREFRLGWSVWLRAHQAVAKRCHTASRTVRGASGKDEPPSLPVSTTTTTLDRRSARLTDEEWAYLRPLLPDNEHRGRQWREHRTVLEAILWVLTGGASWRDLPEEFGPWQTAYYRYVRWRREGLWQRIVEMLRC